MRKSVAAALAAFPILLGGPAPAAAENDISEGLAGALFAFQLGLAQLRHFDLECRPEIVTEEYEAQFERAGAILAASFHASGLPEEWGEEVPATISMRLSDPDCGDVGLESDSEWIEEEGWAAFVTQALENLDLAVVSSPPGSGSLAEVEALFEEETATRARMIQCVTAADPLGLPEVYGAWRKALIDAGRRLVEAGYPRSRVVELVSRAEAATVPESVGPEMTMERRRACEADDWDDIYETDDFEGLTAGIDAILARH